MMAKTSRKKNERATIGHHRLDEMVFGGMINTRHCQDVAIELDFAKSSTERRDPDIHLSILSCGQSHFPGPSVDC
jgi:hypothetical protein